MFLKIFTSSFVFDVKNSGSVDSHILANRIIIETYISEVPGLHFHLVQFAHIPLRHYVLPLQKVRLNY